ncbi:MAG: hypothetical protein IJ167_01250 [Lachnospiraceae bacterium]|nr:hypothetical protein [Eubacterium sp.]MBQ9232647.1 hypothetical protein [Lachnospiraceae bacterium]
MDFNEILGIDQLNLYFDISVDGFDGECFSYSVYFEGVTAEERLADIQAAMDSAIEAFGGEDHYMGYIDVTVEGDKVFVYHDLGGVEPEENNAAIHAALKALNDVKGIKNVVINEGSGFDF